MRATPMSRPTLLFEEADDAVHGGEPEGATAGQEQGVRGTDGADRSEAVGLARTREEPRTSTPTTAPSWPRR